MTQKHVQISAYAVLMIAVLMILGLSTAWAEAKKERSRELLPAPKCCCDQSQSVLFGCCAATQASSCCAKQTQNVTANHKPCDIEHWLQSACPLDVSLKIVVEETACDEAGRSLENPLTLKMKGISFANLLGTLLNQSHLAYVVKGNVLQISSEAPAGDKVISKIYPVGNLVLQAEPIILPTAGGDVFFGWSTRTPTGARLLDNTPEEELMDLVMNTIKPQSWRENGGSGTIDYVPVSKSLVVSQTTDVQIQIGDFLAALHRFQEQQSSDCRPAPFQNMPTPIPAEAASPQSAPPVALAVPMPQFFPPAMPPALSFAPFPPPALSDGLRPPPAVCPPPLAPRSTPHTYALEARTIRCTPDGKKQLGPIQKLVFRPNPCFRGQMAIAYKEAGQHRNWVLQVKATALKNERLHLEVIGVQAKAENSNNGEIALGLDVTPLLDRAVKVGKPVKKVLEKEQSGTPRKWIVLTVEQVEQTPLGAVWPQPVDEVAPASVPTAPTPVESLSAYAACQSPGASIPPGPAVFQCPAGQLENGPGETWRIRSVALEGKTRLIIRQGDQDSVTIKTLDIRIPGGDTLKLSTAGEQVHAENGTLEAQADAVSRTGQPGCFLFEGHVNLVCKQTGESSHVIAERVWVNLADGRLEFQAASR
jgi:hypothetical protein